MSGDADARRMERREIAVLRSLGFGNPYRPHGSWPSHVEGPERHADDAAAHPQARRRPRTAAQLREMLRNAARARPARRRCAVDGRGRARCVGPAGARHHGAAQPDDLRARRRSAAARILLGGHRFRTLALSGAGRGRREDHRHPAGQGPAAPVYAEQQRDASISATGCARRCSCPSPSGSTCC